MPKRKHSGIDKSSELNDIIQGKLPNKHSLDSDEEDEDDESDQKYALLDEDIEGQEDGIVGLEEGVQFTPFNMNEELEEGHFDKNGMYHWKKEKLIRDNWLENIDWIKVKEQEEESKLKENEEDEMPEVFDSIKVYKEILKYLQPRETILKALKRLGGNKSLSASERLKLKKAGKSLEDIKGNSDKVIQLTELVNNMLTATGNMDIYQETYEHIHDKIEACSSKPKLPDLDMYADDFEEKEKKRLSESVNENQMECKNFNSAAGKVITWEYKEKENSDEIKGPYSTEQMAKWSESGHFKSGVLVRKCGTDHFYTSNRIDFELYL